MHIPYKHKSVYALICNAKVAPRGCDVAQFSLFFFMPLVVVVVVVVVEIVVVMVVMVVMVVVGVVFIDTEV